MKKEDVKKGMRFEALNTSRYWTKGDRGTVIKADDGNEDSKVVFDHNKDRYFYIMWEHMAPAPPKGLKRTEIDIIPLRDGKVEIKAIRHVAWMKEISKKYGARVKNIYVSGSPSYMYSSGDGKDVRIRLPHGVRRMLCVDATYSRQRFDYIVDTMRSAGDRLGKIIREDRERKKREEEEAQAKAIKTIKI
jgi:hypothetical protein